MNKNYSLRKSKDIEATIKNRTSTGNRYFAIYFKKNNLDKPRVAISVSKKSGNAVVRNYQKRVIREIVTKHLEEFMGYDVLIVIKTLATQLSFLEKEAQIVFLLQNKNRRKK